MEKEELELEQFAYSEYLATTFIAEE